MIDNDLENLSDRITNEINASFNLESLKTVELKYNTIPHPHVGYRFGERFLKNNDKKSAFKHLIQSCSLALNNNNIWINTGYANSVGHCFYYLLTQYDYNQEHFSIIKKIFANSYFFLSICVINMQEEAYDSCRTRGKLTNNFNHTASNSIFLEYFGPPIPLQRDVMSIADNFLASIGLTKYGKENDSNICMNMANQKFLEIQDSYYFDLNPNIELYQFVDISKEISLKFVNNLLRAYKSGTFDITNQEWEEISNSQN